MGLGLHNLAGRYDVNNLIQGCGFLKHHTEKKRSEIIAHNLGGKWNLSNSRYKPETKTMGEEERILARLEPIFSFEIEYLN